MIILLLLFGLFTLIIASFAIACIYVIIKGIFIDRDGHPVGFLLVSGMAGGFGFVAYLMFQICIQIYNNPNF